MQISKEQLDNPDIEYLIADIDDTTAATSRAHAVSTTQAIEHVAETEFTEEDYHKYLKLAPIHSIPSTAETALERLGIEHDNSTITRIVELKNLLYPETLQEFGQEIAGVRIVMNRLARQRRIKRFGVASGGRLVDVLATLQLVGVRDLFQTEHMVTQEDKHIRLKPKPDQFYEAARRMGIPESEWHKIAICEDDKNTVANLIDDGGPMVPFAFTTRYSREEFGRSEGLIFVDNWHDVGRHLGV